MNAQSAHDALLEWCSEMGSGKVDDFRASCAYLKLDAGVAARALDRLGHVEFDREGGRFAAAETTLTAIPGLPGRMILTGARPRGLLGRLAQINGESDLDVDVVREPCHQFGNGPSTMLVEADPADAPAFCELARIAYAPRAHAAIAELLPQVSVETASVAHRPDSRFPHALIDSYTFQPRWDLEISDGRPGLWLYRSWGWRRNMILRNEGDEPRLVLDEDYAAFLMERPDDADPIVEYKSAHSLLVVNTAAPLPKLHARAACLCSGRVPIRRDIAPGVATDHFVNVDASTADLILGSLGVCA